MHIQDIQKSPGKRPASPDEYRDEIIGMATRLNAATGEFLRRYPADMRKWDARLAQIESRSAIDSMEGHPDADSLKAALDQLSIQPDAPASVRGQARFEVLGLAVGAHLQGDPAVTAATIVDQLHQFAVDFPTYPGIDVLKYRIAEALAANDPAASTSLLKELADSGQGAIPDQARKELATREKLKHPIDLRFTDLDGDPVDLASMRGKVVLLDFWATVSGPCRAELPNVLAAYNNLHDKGFEIVGVSLDQDKRAVLNFTAANHMTWPQYFDGRGWQNVISSYFGINALPAMWLVNKKGYVVSTNGSDNLEAKVAQLLAE